MNLNELRDKAYKTACEHGFHDQELSNNHFLCLVISELMEAVEADRKGRRANVDRYNKKIANSRICQGLDSDIPKERGYEVAYNETIKVWLKYSSSLIWAACSTFKCGSSSPGRYRSMISCRTVSTRALRF